MGGLIVRDPAGAAGEGFDAIVVGGGIYGVALALEASLSGRRPLLLERADFGGATSWNSLRIVHGGLRYLQRLDLARFRDSVGERRWLLAQYPGRVEPLACLMPLYGKGAKRPVVLRAALALNDALSRRRNDGVREDRHLPGGRVLDAAATAARFPAVDRDGLQGGALWYDAVVADSQRLLMELLRRAVGAGAVALNYVEALAPIVGNGAVAGVRAIDRETGDALEFRAPMLLNAAGPDAPGFAAAAGEAVPGLFAPSLAFNLFLRSGPELGLAVALEARRRGARTYFMHPWKGGLFAGTCHAACPPDGSVGVPGPEKVARFLDALAEALPGWRPTPDDVLRIHWGLLPAKEAGTDRLAVRPVLWNHGAHGGPTGLYSLSGVKFTTARLVARRTLDGLGFERRAEPAGLTEPVVVAPAAAVRTALDAGDDAFFDGVRRLMRDESALHLGDLLLRRTDWGIDPRVGADIARRLVGRLGWTEDRQRDELRRYRDEEIAAGAGRWVG